MAVWPVINVECFVPGRGGPAIQPHLVSEPEIANAGWREYGNRAGVARLARVFADLQLPASAALNADICTFYPAVLDTVLTAGWEIVGHGINNSTGHAGMSAESEAATVREALDTIATATGARPSGWLTPGFSVTPRTPTILAGLGLRYTADTTDDDTPHALITAAGPILALPYSLETNDISLCIVARYTATEYAATLFDHVARLAAEAGAGPPTIVALGLHPFIAGQPARAAHLAVALERIQALPGVWFATGATIVELLSAR